TRLIAPFFLMSLRPPRSPLFPYTTLFRSSLAAGPSAGAAAVVFGDVHDLVLVDEQIGSVFPRQTHHGDVVVFDPAAKSLARKQRSEEHTSELQSLTNLVCRLLLLKKKK